MTEPKTVGEDVARRYFRCDDTSELTEGDEILSKILVRIVDEVVAEWVERGA